VPFTWTNTKGKSMTATHEVIVMKTLNSEAIMGLDLIRKLGITYLSVEDKFIFESCFQKSMIFQIAFLIPKKEMHIPVRSSQPVKVGNKLDGFDRHCPPITSLAEIFCADHPDIMGPPLS
jgi:hypothetical protein